VQEMSDDVRILWEKYNKCPIIMGSAGKYKKCTIMLGSTEKYKKCPILLGSVGKCTRNAPLCWDPLGNVKGQCPRIIGAHLGNLKRVLETVQVLLKIKWRRPRKCSRKFL
jgi:hypothetical protein